MDRLSKQFYLMWFVPLSFIVTILLARYSEGNLLFHSLAEFFTIIVGITMTIVSYFTYQFTKNSFLHYLGMGYFWIAILDLFHMFTFRGMMIYASDDTNITLTFWVFSRLFEALLMLSALFVNFSIVSKTKIFSLFALFSAFVYWLAFSPYMPIFFIDGIGLTSLKIASEYTIVFILLVSLFIYKKNKNLLDASVYKYVIISIIFTILSELTFTLYIDINDYINMLGHLFKFLSFWMIFMAIVQTSLKKPFMLMAQESNTYNAIPVPAIVVDNDGVIRQINKATESLLKLTKSEILYRSNHTLFHNTDISESDCRVCNTIKSGGELSSYEVYREPYTYSFTVSPIHLAHELTGAIQVCIDISQQKNTENALRQSEQHLQTIIDNEPECVKIIDAQGRLIEMNHAGLAMLEADTLEEIQKYPLKAYILPEWHAPFVALHNDVMGGKSGTLEFEIIGLKGTHRWLDTHAVPMHDKNGNVTMLLGITRDITQRKKTELELKKLQTAIEQTPVSIVITDTLGNLEYVNPQFLKVTGYTEEEVIGKNPSVLATGYTSKDEYIELWNKISNNETWSGVFKNRKKNGDEYWESAIISPVKNTNGEIVNFIGIKQDISEKMFLESLIKDQEELIIVQSRHAAMGEMIGMIAHQWRQPLSVISMRANNLLLDVVLDKLDAVAVENAAESILKQVYHLSHTIDDFRNFFRPEKEKESANIKDVIDETLSIIGHTLKGSGINVSLNLSSSPVISTYKREFIQVLINLLNNAKEAMDENSNEKKELSINVKEDDKTITLDICDNGGGINEDIIKKIFEPYFSTKDEKTGTGLGLYMSKIIIEKHLKGKLTALNNNIGGACFIITMYK